MIVKGDCHPSYCIGNLDKCVIDSMPINVDDLKIKFVSDQGWQSSTWKLNISNQGN